MVTVLEDFVLIPAIELEPSRFSTHQRPLPSGTWLERPSEWHQYWLHSLADAGITGLGPLRPGSWLVPTREVKDPATIERILLAMIEDWGGKEGLSDPHCHPVLNGGLALCCADEVWIEPTCCADLRSLSDWRESAEYRSSDWQMLWIGHPWISVRFDGEYLILSGPHEREEPVARWKVRPDLLSEAVADAEVELEVFARRLRPVMTILCGEEAAYMLARKLAGLSGSAK